MRLRAKHLLLVWLLGFLSSFVIQSVFQGWFGDATSWGRNVGWQTEIAIWNIGISLVLMGLLRGSESAHEAAVPGLLVLSLAFGANHLQAATGQPARFGNWVGACLNFFAVCLAAFYYISRRRSAAQ